LQKIKLFLNVKKCKLLINQAKISLGMILGSGIELDESMVENKSIFYVETSGIHKKIVYSGTIQGKNILVFQGRKHFYEGHTHDDLVQNVKSAAEMGVKNLLITNAAGGLNENFTEGDLMLITSSINFNSKLLYPKRHFPFSKSLGETFMNCARDVHVKVYEGVYGMLSGPTYETKAEIRTQKKYGMDAAGMSTIPEVYEAAKLGMNVIAVSVITNLLRETSVIPASHEDVVLNAKTASKNLNPIIRRLVYQLN
jgi:purine-nucleoside phosphorylase